MRGSREALACMIAMMLLSGSQRASADDAADLRVRRFPLVTPTSLTMRVAQTTNAGSDEPAEAPLDPEVGEDALVLEIDAQLKERVRASDVLGQRREIDDKVVLQVSLGIGIEGGQPSGNNLLSGEPLTEQQNYARLRTYGFGDVVIGTNGLGTSSLRSYLASAYRFENRIGQDSTPIPSVYDGDFGAYTVRSAWIDVEDVFDNRYFAPLYLRVGRQYKYAAATAHFSGLTVGYRTRAIRAAVFAGDRVQIYETIPGGGGAISGYEITADLYELRRLPIVLTASGLRFDSTNHFDGSAALRFGRNALLRGHVRSLNGELAQENLRLRGRLTEVTTINAEIDNRHAADWAYDFLLAREAPGSAIDARSYLNLGPPRPRLRSALRAGTVLFKNIDLLAQLGGAFEYALNAEFAPTSTRSSYVEGGAAVEVSVRRGFRLSVSGLARAYRRPADEVPELTPLAPDLLPEVNAGTGETTFVEGGSALRYSLGARVFNASMEFYGRRFRFASPYIRDGDPTPDLRTGGRFSIDGWATKQVRVRLDYDLSFTSIRYAPELAGVKTLRASVEGTF